MRMKKFLLSLSAAIVAVCGYAQSVSYDFAKDTDFDSWDTSYKERVCTFDDAVVTFKSANKQAAGQSIDDCPVTKGGDVTVVLTNNTKAIQSLTFTCKQWGSKAQTITLHCSSNEGIDWTQTEITSKEFVLSASTLPAGTNAVKFTFSNSSNQVGVVSLAMEISSEGGSAPVAVEGVKITDEKGEELSNVMLTVTETIGLKAAFTPANATNKNVTWEVMQEGEVISFKDGVVTALAPGKAAVVVTTEDGEKQAAVTIYVSAIEDATIAAFVENQGKTCYLTGTVSAITNDQYGNFTLTDKSGSIVVYGCLNAAGESKKFAELGVAEGDIIKVIASEYKLFTPKEGDPYDEAVNVVFVENLGHAAAEVTFEVAVDGNDFTITPSDETVNYYVEVALYSEELTLDVIEAYLDGSFEDMGSGLEYFKGVSTQNLVDDWYADAEDGLEYLIIVCAVDADYTRISAVTLQQITLVEGTGIQTVEAGANNGAIYNLAGLKVDANFKGIVVKNGKKMLVK